MSPVDPFAPLPLSHGAPLPNRLAKAAMEERLGTRELLPSERLLRLYETWSRGGAGLIVTGNVMVDARAMTGAGGVALEASTPLDAFERWAEAARAGGARAWMQLNHPGRQVPGALPGVRLAPSAVALDLGAHSSRFAMPEAMTERQIADVVERFAASASRAVAAGFDGVEIHAAHGYLLSQFLSPRTNLREDAWGGDLERRSRLLREVVARTRAGLPASASVAVKLNSADFQRGGFDVDDAIAVVGMLGGLGVDLVELSGGTYESPAMQGRARDARSLEREAYFLDLAERIAAIAPMPIMLTGGISRRATVERVLAAGIDVVGMATALAVSPALPRTWRREEAAAPALRAVRFGDKAVASATRQAQVRHQLRRIAEGKPPCLGASPARVLVTDRLRERRDERRYARWLARRR